MSLVRWLCGVSPLVRMTGRRVEQRVVCGLVVLLVLGPMLCDRVLGGDGSESEASLQSLRADVAIYGGTSGGVIAAIQTARLGRTAVLIEPGSHLGGLTSGGLGATDIGNKGAIGGLSREFYQRVKSHYEKADSWRQEEPVDYRHSPVNRREDAMWYFEPHVAEAIYREWLGEYADAIQVLTGERLDRAEGVAVDEGRIVSITMTSGRKIEADMWIDATYEGDLMAAAGVSYTVGREANETYGETLNGVQTRMAVHHQIVPGVDPYRVAGDPTSGLLPGIDPEGPGEEGAGDHRVQAYCLRMCVTDVKANQRPFERPDDYDPLEYELLLRNFDAGETREPWNPLMMPNRKTDANNNFGVSTDWIGHSYTWAEADDETRQQIYQEHLRYQRGLMWTLANHPRVPEKVRREISRWGTCLDEFPENSGWSHQLYIREARRMVGELVMTQHHCQGRELAPQPIGLAAYTMDSHHVQRYVDAKGQVQNEGDVQVGGFPPYPIGYGAILPQADECQNLLVPVGLSASHIAYGSIRMEPVFMVLGQSAATAAVLALDSKTTLHGLDYESLRERLVEDEQVLEWTAQTSAWGIDPKKLEGYVLDDLQAKRVGAWTLSQSTPGFVASGYLHDGNSWPTAAELVYEFEKLPPGDYEVRLAYTAHPNRATAVPVTIHSDGDARVVKVNQRQAPTVAKAFVSLGKQQVGEAGRLTVRVSNRETDGHVIGDAVWLVPVAE